MTLFCLQGLVRNIGISNFSIRKTQEVLAFCRIRPAVNQVGNAHPCTSCTIPDARQILSASHHSPVQAITPPRTRHCAIPSNLLDV